MMQSKGIGSLWQIYKDGIFKPIGRVVLVELLPEPSHLDADGRIHLGIEVGRTSEDLGRDLVFLRMSPGMIDRISGQIAQQLAERFGPMQQTTIRNLFDLG